MPYAFVMASARLVVTMVLMRAPFAGRVPISFLSRRIYSAISIPDIFPVNGIYSPVAESFAYIPSLSASGSVARTMSASFSFASLRARVKALGSSGLGYSRVVNSGSGSSCSGTTYTCLNPSSDSIRLTGRFPVPWNGV